jgi:hypothetical protein
MADPTSRSARPALGEVLGGLFCLAYAVAVVLAAGVLVLGVGLITRQAQKT